MKQSTNNTTQLIKSPCGGFRGLYNTPRIEIITLDNEISLQLESNPPLGPNETLNISVSQPNPFKNWA